MREFSPVIETFVLAMLDTRDDLRFCCGIALQLIGDQHPWCVTQALEELAEKAFCCLPVAPTLHQDIEHMTVLIDCTPEIVVLALDCEDHLVEMPFVPALRLTPAKFIGIALAELHRPLADRLVRDDDATACHQLFYVAKTQREPEVKPDDMPDDFCWVAEAAVK